MKFKLSLINNFWLLIPLLLWNILLAPKITNEKVFSDANSPQWLLIAESITRLGVFALPLFMPLQFEGRQRKVGLIVFVAGTLIYFASWIPLLIAPESSWSISTIGLLAPRLTPLLFLLGIALIAHSWEYAGLSVIFIFLHTWHGIQNL